MTVYIEHTYIPFISERVRIKYKKFDKGVKMTRALAFSDMKVVNTFLCGLPYAYFYVVMLKKKKIIDKKVHRFECPLHANNDE